ncbi:hypothetical protein Vi05172_g2461 [Venturia inaequalis]|nr:hypothetical protein Vi05172_g2461 [Venturia inaequalis]
MDQRNGNFNLTSSEFVDNSPSIHAPTILLPILTQIPLLTGSLGSSGFLHRPPPIELCGKLGRIGGLAESRMDCETERMNNPPAAGSTIVPSPKWIQRACFKMCYPSKDDKR